MLEFRNLSGQLSRRSIDIHFPRYQADCSSDLIEFQRVLKSKCIQIAAEAIEGEKAFQFESGELSLLRQKLGLPRASSSITDSDNQASAATSRKKTKSRPGVRQPSRDVVGEM